MNTILSNLQLKPQECVGTHKFSGRVYLTQGFIQKFGKSAVDVAKAAHQKVLELVKTGADYLQMFELNGVKFWMIDDGSSITVLLPEEY